MKRPWLLLGVALVLSGYVSVASAGPLGDPSDPGFPPFFANTTLTGWEEDEMPPVTPPGGCGLAMFDEDDDIHHLGGCIVKLAMLDEDDGWIIWLAEGMFDPGEEGGYPGWWFLAVEDDDIHHLGGCISKLAMFEEDDGGCGGFI